MRAKTCIDGSNPSVSAKYKRPLVGRLYLARDATVDEASGFDEHPPRAKDTGGEADGGPAAVAAGRGLAEATRGRAVRPSPPNADAPSRGVCILDTASRLEHTQSRESN